MPLVPGQRKTGYSKKGLAILNAHHRAAATASGRWQCSDSDPGPLLVGAWQSGRETEQEGVTVSQCLPPMATFRVAASLMPHRSCRTSAVANSEPHQEGDFGKQSP